MTQKWRLCLDALAAARAGSPEARSPVRTVDAVTVYDAAGSAARARPLRRRRSTRHARPARLHLASAPPPGRAMNGIEIDFTAGFGDTARRRAGRPAAGDPQHVAQMYELRGAVPRRTSRRRPGRLRPAGRAVPAEGAVMPTASSRPGRARHAPPAAGRRGDARRAGRRVAQLGGRRRALGQGRAGLAPSAASWRGRRARWSPTGST